MRKCLLHIGMHKTGSSAIQQACFFNRAQLSREFNIHYFSEFQNHSALAPCFLKSPDQYFQRVFLKHKNLAESQSYYAGLKARLTAEINKMKGGTFLLSAEGFTKFTLAEAQRLGDFLKPLFDEIEVFVYVRHPFTYANSAAQQTLKGGQTFADISTSLFDLNAVGFNAEGRSSIHPAYQYRIEKYQKIFGKKNVTIREYDRAKLLDQSIVSDFFQHAFKLSSKKLFKQDEAINPSLGMEAAFLLESLNRNVPILANGGLNPARSQAILPYLKKLKAEREFELTEFPWARYRNYVIDDVEWLSAQTHGRINFNLSSLPKYKPYTPPEEIDDMANELNELLLTTQRAQTRAQVFRKMWLMETGLEDDQASFLKLIKESDDLQFIVNIAHNLNKTNKKGLALKVARIGKSKCNASSDPAIVKKFDNQVASWSKKPVPQTP